MEQNTHKKISYGLVIASFIIFLLYILLNCILDFSGGQGLLLFLIFLYTETPIAIGFVVHSCWYCFKFEKLITAWYIYIINLIIIIWPLIFAKLALLIGFWRCTVVKHHLLDFVSRILAILQNHQSNTGLKMFCYIKFFLTPHR